MLFSFANTRSDADRIWSPQPPTSACSLFGPAGSVNLYLSRSDSPPQHLYFPWLTAKMSRDPYGEIGFVPGCCSSSRSACVVRLCGGGRRRSMRGMAMPHHTTAAKTIHTMAKMKPCVWRNLGDCETGNMVCCAAVPRPLSG